MQFYLLFPISMVLFWRLGPIRAGVALDRSGPRNQGGVSGVAAFAMPLRHNGRMRSYLLGTIAALTVSTSFVEHKAIYLVRLVMVAAMFYLMDPGFCREHRIWPAASREYVRFFQEDGAVPGRHVLLRVLTTPARIDPAGSHLSNGTCLPWHQPMDEVCSVRDDRKRPAIPC
jgi:hypothetical protein